MLALIAGQQIDRLPFVIQWGPWPETQRRWLAEGMKNRDDWHTLFGFDTYAVYAGVNCGICPAFPEEILLDEGETVICRDAFGVIKRDRKDQSSMPAFLEYPVKDRESWEAYKWRFDAGSAERFPPNWEALLQQYAAADALVSVGIYPFGFLGGVRTIMGAEACLLAMALDPELIDDINTHFCDLWDQLWSRLFAATRIDHIAFWEDMAGKQGSLISPAMFRRFLTPYYERLIDLSKQHGVTMFSVDSDGYMPELTGLFLEAGVNVVMPYEVQAGNDLASLFRTYPELVAFGGMDKRVMAVDHQAIDAEMRRIKALLSLGRFVPFPDHCIPPDVSWENYQYFVWRWKELVGKA